MGAGMERRRYMGVLAFPCLCLGSEAHEGPRRGLLPLLKIFLAFFGINISF